MKFTLLPSTNLVFKPSHYCFPEIKLRLEIYGMYLHNETTKKAADAKNLL